ncbi:MAG: NADH-quinone oxidoreductase subunit [Alphaproteobacteria bacterium]|jgi:NADH-quinone oxidoreductase subunit J|nr:NADH-quinone oxidoreductase subunit [Alphaproteobacteria bacterium]
MIQTALFYLFSGTLIASAAMVVVGRNPVHSVLFLILAFLNAAGLFLLAGAELLAMIMVIVYVGAVAVLFLFVVMMLDINFRELAQGMAKYKWIGSLVGIILAGELVTVGVLWMSHPNAQKGGKQPILEGITNAHAIGQVLYTDYFYSFQLSGVILLVAMMGAIVLTLRTRPSARRQNYREQLNRSPVNSLEMVKVASGQGVKQESVWVER